jgi:hypothetical protein
MRQLTLTNKQFDALFDIVKDAVDYIEGDLITTEDDNGNEVLEDISDYEAYQIYQQLVSLKNDAKVTISDKVYPEVDNISDNIKKDWLYNKDDDYAVKVDRLVGNMAASNDKEFTHDSEGC